MLKSLKKIASILIVAVFLLNVNIPTMAYSSNSSQSIAYNNFSSFIGDSLGLDCEITSVIPLYNDAEEIIANCFLLSCRGYAITDLNGTVIEAIFEESETYNLFNSVEERIYYGGPLNYYTKSQDYFVDMSSGDEVSNEIVASNISSFENIVIPVSMSSRAARGITMRYDLEHTLPTISYNPQNVHCASTAAAIVLHYMDDYKNSSLVPDYLDDATGVALIDYLIPFIHGTPSVGAVTVIEISNGVIGYFEDQNITGYTSAWAATSSYTTVNLFQECRSLIEADLPIIILFTESQGYEGAYKNHFMVVHGLLQDISGGQYYAYLNNGYGTNNIFINLIYANSVAVIG